MIDKALKEKMRLYFETHFESAKELAQRFDVKYRTLMVWIKNEGWIMGKALDEVCKKNIKEEALKTEFGSILHLNKEQIKQNLKDNLNLNHYTELSELDEILEGLSDDLLFKMMNSDFLHKEMIKGALIAKEELLKMRTLSKRQSKANVSLIVASEKYVNMLGNIQKNLYDDKILSKALNSPLEKELESLSTNELLALIEDKSEENAVLNETNAQNSNAEQTNAEENALQEQNATESKLELAKKG